MKILLIGGTGFVSGTVAKVALEAGHDVTVVTRGIKPIPAGLKQITADRFKPGSLEAAIANAGCFDFIVDCFGFKKPDAMQDVFALAPRCARFAFISTDFVYDPAYRQFPQPETNMHFLTDDSYGANKRRCEEVFLNAAQNGGFSHWTIFRPCHIYGPNSKLGCLPNHGRDPELIDRILRGEPLELAAAGTLLQQPIYAEDLAKVILSCVDIPKSCCQFYNCAGPEIAESATYYKIIADYLNRPLKIKELPIQEYKAQHPENISFLCHRVYDLAKLKADGLYVPQMPLAEGLRIHTASLLHK
jgi:nucleoside-diphosphate-sugar epimerase